jgi:hypothetical protein
VQQEMQQGLQAQQGSQLGNQTVGLMNEPPAVLTDKDHHYLKDALSWELLAMKKCHQLAGVCQNQEVAALANRLGSMHQQHYQRLLDAVDPQKTLM